MPQMAEASVVVVWASIKDPTFLAIRLVREETERALEEMMPLVDILPGRTMAKSVEGEGPLTDKQKQLMAELFENLEVVHKSAAQACSIMARLWRSLNSSQFKLVLHKATSATKCTRDPVQ